MTRPPAETLLNSSPVLAGWAVEAPHRQSGDVQGMPQKLFISGHSLVDVPFPDLLAALAASAGNPIEWGAQQLVGSSIRQRSPASLPGPYDGLLITEQHTLLGTLMWNDTVQHLGQWHEAFIASNAAGRTWFYVPWLSLDEKYQPARWIAYETAAAPVWQCIVTRINAQRASNGHADRIVTVPANLALAYLIGQIAGGRSIPGVTATTLEDSMDRLLVDDVHLTPLGNFYIAAVTYLGLSAGQAAPRIDALPAIPALAGITAQQSEALLAIALEFYEQRDPQRQRALSLADCRKFLTDTFIDDYWRYTYRATLRKDPGVVRGYWSAWRARRASKDYLREHPGNPFADVP